MKCEEVQLKLVDYLDNHLKNGDNTGIEKHLETCERCLDELKETQKILFLISEDKMQTPDEELKINFYNMLHGEMNKGVEKRPNAETEYSLHWYNNQLFRAAAGVALLLAGSFLGYLFHVGLSANDRELAQLHSEVSELKKTAMFSMLKEESSSDRIQAVNYVEGLEVPDNDVIEVLTKTLNNDKNINVRMAAAYALSKYADQKAVCDSLVKSLSAQTDPILQVTLINILVDRKEKSALKPIQAIIANRKTLNEVRAVAENSLRVLI
jgi:hypothetical protein